MRATDDYSEECEQLLSKINRHGMGSLNKKEMSDFLVYAAVPDNRTYEPIMDDNPALHFEENDLNMYRKLDELYRPNELGKLWLENSVQLFSNLTKGFTRPAPDLPDELWTTLKLGVYARIGRYMLVTGRPKTDKTVFFWFDYFGRPTGHFIMEGTYPKSDVSYTHLCEYSKKCHARFAAMLYTFSGYYDPHSDIVTMPSEMCRVLLDSINVLPLMHCIAGHPGGKLYEHPQLKKAKL